MDKIFRKFNVEDEKKNPRCSLPVYRQILKEFKSHYKLECGKDIRPSRIERPLKLFINNLSDWPGAISVSMSCGSYGVNGRYKRAIVKFLVDYGYITFFRGYYRDNNKGARSQIKRTQKFAKIVAKNTELRKRVTTGVYLKTENDRVRLHCGVVNDVNRRITVLENLGGLLEKTKIEGVQGGYTRLELRSVFNKSLESGGRIYHLLQNLPKSERALLRFDNEKVCEPDFDSLHIHLLYGINGLTPPQKDLYLVGENSKEQRRLNKLIMITMLNVSNEEAAIKATINAIREKAMKKFRRKLKESKIEELEESSYQKEREKLYQKYAVIDQKALRIKIKKSMEGIKKLHRPITHCFCNSQAGYLQYLDSEIAFSVIEKLIGLNIPALPIHDSFIVKEKHLEITRQIMSESFDEVMSPFKNTFKFVA